MKKKCVCVIMALIMTVALLGGCTVNPNQKSGNASAQDETGVAVSTEMADKTTSEGAVDSEKTEEMPDLSNHKLLIYCGAGMQEPFQKIADEFKSATGCEMNITFANAAQIQTQINTTQEGDYFIAGSAEEVKPVEEDVISSKNLVKHIPVLAIFKDNPRGITGLKDLVSSEISTVIGDPESTPIGKIANKAFTDLGIKDSVTLLATTTTAPQLATLVSLGEADAAIVWKENCNVDNVEICNTQDLNSYIKIVPAAKLKFTTDTEASEAFDTFLETEAVKNIWTSYGYELAE